MLSPPELNTCSPVAAPGSDRLDFLTCSTPGSDTAAADPVIDRAIADAWRQHGRAQARPLAGLVTAPRDELERREADADRALLTLRRMGVTP